MSRVSTIPIATAPARAVTAAKIQSAAVSTSIALLRALRLDAERLHLERRRIAPKLAGGRDDTRHISRARVGFHPQHVGEATDATFVLLAERQRSAGRRRRTLPAHRGRAGAERSRPPATARSDPRERRDRRRAIALSICACVNDCGVEMASEPEVRLRREPLADRDLVRRRRISQATFDESHPVDDVAHRRVGGRGDREVLVALDLRATYAYRYANAATPGLRRNAAS